MEEVSKGFENLSDEQKVITSYSILLKQFSELLSTYSGSKKQIQRAWLAAATTPFNNEKIELRYFEEQALFELFDSLTSSKFILMIYELEKIGKIKVLSSLVENQQSTEEDK
jgi:hypothetical protein